MAGAVDRERKRLAADLSRGSLGSVINDRLLVLDLLARQHQLIEHRLKKHKILTEYQLEYRPSDFRRRNI